jgi:hypothetical protein
VVYKSTVFIIAAVVEAAELAAMVVLRGAMVALLVLLAAELGEALGLAAQLKEKMVGMQQLMVLAVAVDAVAVRVCKLLEAMVETV